MRNSRNTLEFGERNGRQIARSDAIDPRPGITSCNACNARCTLNATVGWFGDVAGPKPCMGTSSVLH